MNRILGRARILLLLLVIGAGLFWGVGMAVSVALGGLLAFVNMSWMSAGVDRLLRVQGKSGNARYVWLFVLRLALISGTLFAIIHTSFMSLLGAVAGLSVPVVAGMLEALLLAVKR